MKKYLTQVFFLFHLVAEFQSKPPVPIIVHFQELLQPPIRDEEMVTRKFSYRGKYSALDSGLSRLRKSAKCFSTPMRTWFLNQPDTVRSVWPDQKFSSSRSLMKPLKIGTRSWEATSGPRIMASSWIELASVRLTFHCMSFANDS